MGDELELAGTIRGLRPLYIMVRLVAQRLEGSYGVNVFENSFVEQEDTRAPDHASRAGNDGMRSATGPKPADAYRNEFTHRNRHQDTDAHTELYTYAHRDPGRMRRPTRHVDPFDRE